MKKYRLIGKKNGKRKNGAGSMKVNESEMAKTGNGLLIFTGDFRRGGFLPLTTLNILAGFPSPSQDYLVPGIDFNKDLILNPSATFYARVLGNKMRYLGVKDGDIVIIDRSQEPQTGDVVAVYYEEQFLLRYINVDNIEKGYIELSENNYNYRKVWLNSESVYVWGVVIWIISSLRAQHDDNKNKK